MRSAYKWSLRCSMNFVSINVLHQRHRSRREQTREGPRQQHPYFLLNLGTSICNNFENLGSFYGRNKPAQLPFSHTGHLFRHLFACWQDVERPRHFISFCAKSAPVVENSRERGNRPNAVVSADSVNFPRDLLVHHSASNIPSSDMQVILK